ncbi:MAG: hypothetical protein ABR879_00145 [Methanomassiliicoccales archaeon]
MVQRDLVAGANGGVVADLFDYYYSFHCSYDPLTYPPGVEPTFSEVYTSIHHSDSMKRIVLAVDAALSEQVQISVVTRTDSAPA